MHSFIYLSATFPPLGSGYLTVHSLLHVKLSKPTRDALMRPGVGLVHQVGLIMQIPPSSPLAWVKAVILMIKEQLSDRRRRTRWKCEGFGERKKRLWSHELTSVCACSLFALPCSFLSGMCSAGGRIEPFISQQSTLPVSTATRCCIAAASGLYP